MVGSILAFLAPIWANPLVRRALMWLTVIGAVLGGVKVYARSEVKRDREVAARRALEETVRRTDSGREFAARAEASLRAGKTPEDAVATNDKSWR